MKVESGKWKDGIRKRTHSEAYFPLSSLHFHFNLKLHSRAQLIGLVGTAEVLHEGEAKLPGCPRPLSDAMVREIILSINNK